MKNSEKRQFEDRRRRHRHWKVTLFYHDGATFERVYIDRERGQQFAERQKKSPIIKKVTIKEVNTT